MNIFALTLAALAAIATAPPANNVHLHAGNRATVLVKEPCFAEWYGPAKYFAAAHANDRHTLATFDQDNEQAEEYHLTPALRWLPPGSAVRVTATQSDAARVSVESGPAKGSACYVRDSPPASIYKVQ